VVSRAAIYARISSDPEGDRLGVTRQIEDCQALAERKGWPVADVYVDDDKSAWSGRVRPEYRRMLDDIAAGAIDAILVWHPDRLHRRPIELEEFVDVCRRSGVAEVAYVSGSLPVGSDDGLFVARILAAVASKESADKSRRIKRKHEELAKAGVPTGGGTRPYGYRDDRRTVDPVEAEHVREAANRLLAGEGLRSIATDWNERGLLTVTGRHWSLMTLRRMLYSARLSGQRELHGEIVAPGQWEPILTPDGTTRVRAILDEATRSPRRPARRYLLSGLLRCGLCDAPLVSRPTATGDRRYICAKGPGFTGCGRLAIRAEPIEALIAQAVVYRLDTPQLAAALAGAADADTATAAEREALALDRDQLDELARAYAARLISFPEWIRARDLIEERIHAAERRLSRLSRTAAIDRYVGRAGDLQATWATLPLMRQRSVVAALMDRAVVRPAVRGRGTFDPDRVDPVWRA
jgi:DNA invertase Pin-like site-specific DNA recombinase